MKKILVIITALVYAASGVSAQNQEGQNGLSPVLKNLYSTIDADAPASVAARPLIGVSATGGGSKAMANSTYIQAILKAGGIPVIIPQETTTEELRVFVKSIDGLLMTGGEDIDPKYYDTPLSELTEEINAVRDIADMTLIKLAYDRNVPMLGICRGIQTINVALGGTLYQDVPAEFHPQGERVKHRRDKGETGSFFHDVAAVEGSEFAAVTGKGVCSALTSHHQAVKEIAPDFKATGFSSDGMVEAIEAYPCHPVLAVQFHPEVTPDNETCNAIFTHLVNKAATYRKAREIHSRIITLDSHTDTAFELNSGGSLGKRGDYLVSLQKMDEGGLDAQYLAIYQRQGELDAESLKKAIDKVDNTIDLVLGDIAKYPDHCGLALSEEDVRRLKAEGKKAFLLGIENGYGIGNDLSRIRHFYDRGVRYMTLCHTYDNLICTTSNHPEPPATGLTKFGRKVVKEMNRTGMLIDLSHASMQSFYDALELSKDPIFCSHSSSKALCMHNRNLDDDQARALAAKGGVVQVCILSHYLNRDNKNASIVDAIEHIDHLVKVAGIDHVGIGSDFDGGGGVKGCNGDNDLINITVALLEKGYSEEDLEKLWGGNLLRLMNQVCGK
ncbi:MAG: membrane dipeptidase [Bacteroidales bacterium]|nr:membrane dipeptidase [Bacteroidales bacterium]